MAINFNGFKKGIGNIQAFSLEVGHFWPAEMACQRGSVQAITGPPSRRTAIATLHYFNLLTSKSLT